MLQPFTPTIVAEIGNNHEGSLNIALEMLEKAKECGVDIVKFQAGVAEGFARTADQIERYKKYELGEAGYLELANTAKKLDIPIMFSVWGDQIKGNEWLKQFKFLDYYKIAARQSPEVILNGDIELWDNPNTIMSISNHIELNDGFRGYLGKTKYMNFLHTVSEYPTKDPHLYRIKILRNSTTNRIRQNVNYIGYSDHCIGLQACIDAVKIWDACIIEKHFTLAHDFGPLRDHQLSATPKEMRELVEVLKTY